MPQTSFTCRDKILGGYYADAETNCQMFHICVKVAGVGVSSETKGRTHDAREHHESSTYAISNRCQERMSAADALLSSDDCNLSLAGGKSLWSLCWCSLFALQIQDFRFLCPNGTAFDQEAQICADWGDVDCEAATLYYGSDNFDLYRIGSNFESKKSKFVDEDESVFHLQHAETSLHKILWLFHRRNAQQNVETSFQAMLVEASSTSSTRASKTRSHRQGKRRHLDQPHRPSPPRPPREPRPSVRPTSKLRQLVSSRPPIDRPRSPRVNSSTTQSRLTGRKTFSSTVPEARREMVSNQIN